MSKQIQKAQPKVASSAREKVGAVEAFRVLANNCKNDFDFYIRNYFQYQAEKGSVFTWGSGEMGQLGYSQKIISLMPKDREGYPFQVNLIINRFSLTLLRLMLSQVKAFTKWREVTATRWQ